MCLPSMFWRTERRTVVIPMTSQFGCLELLITRTFLSGPVKFEITRVDCISKYCLLKIIPRMQSIRELFYWMLSEVDTEKIQVGQFVSMTHFSQVHIELLFPYLLMLSSLGKIFSRQHFKIFLLFFPRKQNLTFHANCLQWRQFA